MYRRGSLDKPYEAFLAEMAGLVSDDMTVGRSLSDRGRHNFWLRSAWWEVSGRRDDEAPFSGGTDRSRSPLPRAPASAARRPARLRMVRRVGGAAAHLRHLRADTHVRQGGGQVVAQCQCEALDRPRHERRRAGRGGGCSARRTSSSSSS